MEVLDHHLTLGLTVWPIVQCGAHPYPSESLSHLHLIRLVYILIRLLQVNFVCVKDLVGQAFLFL